MDKKLTKLVLIILLVLSFSVNASAMNSGLELSDYGKAIDSFNDIRPLDEEPTRQEIECFDVNEYENIAIGYSNFSRKTIAVYSKSNEFLYGYRFKCTGAFAIEWDNENIIIYYIRSGIAVLLDPAGNVCEVKTVVNSAQSNRHLSNYLQSPKKTVNGVEYYLKDKPGFLEWSKASYSIMGYISNGEDTVLHDASDFYYLKRIIDITVFTGLFAYAIIAAYRYHKKH